MPSLTVALVQHPPVFLNLDASVEKACALVAQAAPAGARLVVFPETWLPGYPVWLDYAPKAGLWDYAPAKAVYRTLAENALTLPGPHLTRLLACAHQHTVCVVMGAHERRGGTLYNTLLYLNPDGQTYQLHRKLMPTYTERLVWGQGDGSTLRALNTEYGVVGGLVCWEHWMPLARAAMHAQNEVIHVAQWPAVRDLHQIASRHYAFEGQCFVLAAGTYLTRADVLAGFDSLPRPDPLARELLASMPETGVIHSGGSAVIAPDASYVAGPVFDESVILQAELNLDLITAGHLVMDTNGHYARPDVFQLRVNDKPQMNVTFGET
jgi:predicted amidohydrolase